MQVYSSQTKISGTPGEHRDNYSGGTTINIFGDIIPVGPRYHQGIDVVGYDGPNARSSKVYSMESASFPLVYYDQSSSQNKRVLLGSTIYWHCELSNGFTDGANVPSGCWFGNDTWDHVHIMPKFSLINSGTESNFLNDFSNYIDYSAPSIIEVKFFVEGHDRTHASTLLDKLSPANQDTIVYDKIDVTVKTDDKHTLYNGSGANTGHNGINRITWRILNSNANTIGADFENIDFSNYVKNESSQYGLSKYATTSNHIYVVTNNINTTNPNTYNRYLNTRLKKSSSGIPSWDGPSALAVEDAYYPDGNYAIEFDAYDIRQGGANNGAHRTIPIVVDNFPPYIIKVLIYSGPNLVDWDGREWLSNRFLTPSGTLSNPAYFSDVIRIEIHTSEPMSEVSFKINSSSLYDCDPIGNDGKIWKFNDFTANDTELNPVPGVKNLHIEGKDLAGNNLVGNPEPSPPVRISATAFSPIVTDFVDDRFFFQVVQGSSPDCQDDQYEGNNSNNAVGNSNQTVFYSPILSDNSVGPTPIQATICNGDIDFYQFRANHKGMFLFELNPPLGKDYGMQLFRKALVGSTWSQQTSDLIIDGNILYGYRREPSFGITRNYAIKIYGVGSTDYSASSYDLTMTWCPDCSSSSNRLAASVSIGEGDDPIEYCPGQATVLNALGGGTNYQWFSQEPFVCLNSSCSSIEITPNSSALYTVISILSGQGLCSSIDSIFINYNSNCVITCYTPTSPTENSFTQNSAYLNWASIAGAVGYEVRYRVNGTSTWSTVSTSSSDYSLSGLNCSATYEWQVRTQCTGGTRSSYTVSRTFMTTSCSNSSGASCSNPITLTSNGSGCTYSQQTVAGATPSGFTQEPCDAYTGTAGLADVWFMFQANATTHIINIDPDGSVTGNYNYLDAIVSVYSACNSSSRIHCEDDVGGGGGFTSVTVTNLTIGNYYYIRIYDYGSSQPANPGFNICITHTKGDNCGAPITLTSNNSCIYTSATVTGATASGYSIALCDVYTGTPGLADVWFTFQALATSHTINIDPVGTGTGIEYLDAVVSVYSSCTNSTSAVKICEDDPGGGGGFTSVTVTGLTIGTYYYIRIYDYGASQPINGGFDICVTHTGGAVCNTPTNMREEYIDNDEADLDWTGTSGADYTLQYREENGSWLTVYPTNSDYNITDLECNSTYEWQVKTDCSNGISSSYTNIRSFDTDPCCIEPNNTDEDYIYDNEAKLNWSSVSAADEYKLRYRESGGSWQYEYPSSSVLTITNLFCNTTYEWQVRSECANGENSSYTSIETFTTDATPSQPGSISGNATVCANSTQTYSIESISGATSYTWSIPNGWLGSSDGTSINITSGVTGGTISVTTNNSCASSTPQTLNVSVTNCDDSNPCTFDVCTNGVCQGSIPYDCDDGINCTIDNCNGGLCYNNPQLPAQPDSINGPSTAVCPNTIKAYNVPYESGITYNWTPPVGVTISNGQGTNSVSVTFGNTFSRGLLSVDASNECGTSNARTLNIYSVPSQPGPINGPQFNNCSTISTFRINAVQGATSYLWTFSIPTYTLINYGTWARIKFPDNFSGQGILRVYARNSCGLSTVRTMIIYGTPPAPSAITGSKYPCRDSLETYSVTRVAGAISYDWTMPSPDYDSIFQQDTFIIVKIGSINGNIQVRAVNECGAGALRALKIKVADCSTKTSQNLDETKEFDFKVYPNPTDDNITVEIYSSKDSYSTLEFIDITGKVVKSMQLEIKKGRNRNRINIEQLSSGIYFLRYIDSDHDESIKVIVERK